MNKATFDSTMIAKLSVSTKLLINNFSWSFIGRITELISQWGLIIVLTRIGSPKMVGDFGVALAIISPILVFFELRLRDLITTDLNNNNTFGTYLATRLITVTIAIFVIIPIQIVSGDEQLLWTVAFLSLAKALDTVSDFFFGVMQKYERLDLMGKSLLLKSVVALVVVAILIYQTKSLAYGMFGLIIVNAVFLFFLDLSNTQLLLRTKGQENFSINTHMIGNLIWVAVPLGIAATLSSFATQIPRYFLDGYTDRTMVGYFTAIGYMLMPLGVINISISRSITVKLSRTYQKSRSHFSHELMKSMSFGVGLGVSFLILSHFFGRQLLTIAFGSDYAEFTSVLQWLVVGRIATLMNAYINIGQIIMRLVNAQFVIAGISTILGVIAGWWLVPTYGITGASGIFVVISWANLLISIAHVLYKTKDNEFLTANKEYA